MTLSRRRSILIGSASLGAAALAASPARASSSWDTFKSRFIVAPGRVIDTGNGNVSHSESQGWGMLFAQDHGDRETFDQLWSWSVATLRRRDGLFSWRFIPDRHVGVPDKNNATDGDVLMAWALQRAAKRWPASGYAADARRLRQAIVDRLVMSSAGRRILLPGVEGFNRGATQVLNLSYYVWPAIRSFAHEDGATSPWREVMEDGLAVLDAAAFGAHRLPPDWLLFGKGVSEIAKDWPPRYSFDAVRIPLYLVWGGDRQRLGRFVDAWLATAKDGWPAAWIDLRTGARSDYPGSEGVASILSLCRAALESKAAEPPIVNARDDYYSASLKMLSALAARDLGATEAGWPSR